MLCCAVLLYLYYYYYNYNYYNYPTWGLQWFLFWSPFAQTHQSRAGVVRYAVQGHGETRSNSDMGLSIYSCTRTPSKNPPVIRVIV